MFSFLDLSHRNQSPSHTPNITSCARHSELHSATSRLFAMIEEQKSEFLLSILFFLFNFLRLLICYKLKMMPPLEIFSKEGQFLRHIRSPKHLLVFCQVFCVSRFDVVSVGVFHVFKYFSLLISFNLSRCII